MGSGSRGRADKDKRRLPGDLQDISRAGFLGDRDGPTQGIKKMSDAAPVPESVIH